MAKSTLEIVVQDEGRIDDLQGPDAAASAASTAAPSIVSTGSPTSTTAHATTSTAPQPESRKDRPEITGSDIGKRIVDELARSSGIGRIGGEIGRWSNLLADILRASRAESRSGPPVAASAPAAPQPVTTTSTPPAAPPSVSAPATTAAAAPAVAATAAAPVATGAAPAAAGAAALGPVAIGALAVTAAFAGTVIATRALYNALSEASEGVAAFSAETAAAKGETEIRQQQASINRAARIGPEMADFERTRGRFQERFSNMGTEVLKILLQIWQVIEPFAEKSLSVMEAMVAAAAVLEKLVEMKIDVDTMAFAELKKDTKEMGPLLTKLGKELGEIFTGEKEDPLENKMLDDLEKMGVEMMVRGPGGFPPRRARHGGGRE